MLIPSRDMQHCQLNQVCDKKLTSWAGSVRIDYGKLWRDDVQVEVKKQSGKMSWIMFRRPSSWNDTERQSHRNRRKLTLHLLPLWISSLTKQYIALTWPEMIWMTFEFRRFSAMQLEDPSDWGRQLLMMPRTVPDSTNWPDEGSGWRCSS